VLAVLVSSIPHCSPDICSISLFLDTRAAVSELGYHAVGILYSVFVRFSIVESYWLLPDITACCYSCPISFPGLFTLLACLLVLVYCQNGANLCPGLDRSLVIDALCLDII